MANRPQQLGEIINNNYYFGKEKKKEKRGEAGWNAIATTHMQGVCSKVPSKAKEKSCLQRNMIQISQNHREEGHEGQPGRSID